MTGERPGFTTRAVHAGEHPDPTTGAVVPPVHLSTTFAFPSAEAGAALFAGERPGYIYTRLGNPTVAVLEAKVADLEGGEAALATASGMAAIATVLLTLLGDGGHVVCTDALYSATYDLLARRLPAFGIRTTFVDATDPAALARAITPETRLLYVETPGNPTLTLTDIAAVATVARQHGLPLVVDNTFATPYLQQPLALGADIVVHSATKYLGGHGDAVAGVVVGRRAFIAACREATLADFGGALSPLTAYLVLRGLPTLALRMERHCANAQRVAAYLSQHPKVAWVRYPGLPSHPQHALARRQMRGFGGMVCFELAGGLAAGRALLNAVRLCTLAVSLGDVRTLITHPASTTHHQVPAERRRAMGITDGLVRLSVGIEDPDDIVADLEQALDRVP
jgi:methionine-gamma-lyase